MFAAFGQTGRMSDSADSKNAPLGVISANVAASTDELRQARNLSLRDLSGVLDSIGWPMVPSVLHRIVTGKRRCGPDDVVALSIALDVNPNALLAPRHVTRDDVIELTPARRQRANVAWDWLDGRFPLPPILMPVGTTAVHTPGDRAVFFQQHARPEITSPEPDPAVEELVTLARMLRNVLDTPAPERPVMWAHWRDTILRRWRLAAIQLEEFTDTHDREARSASVFDGDTQAAVDQLRDVGRIVPDASVQFAPGTVERYAENARADRERLHDPSGDSGQ